MGLRMSVVSNFLKIHVKLAEAAVIANGPIRMDLRVSRMTHSLASCSTMNVD